MRFFDGLPTAQGDVELYVDDEFGEVRTANVPLTWENMRTLRAFGQACVRAADELAAQGEGEALHG